MQKEVWRDVPGYERLYQVSNMGRVRSVERLVPFYNGACRRYGGVMRPWGKRGSYLRIQLRKDGRSKDLAVHHIVWAAFFGGRPKGFEINHKNGSKRDNRADNLELVTHSENIKHAYANGLIPTRVGEGNTKAILTDEVVLWMRRRYRKVMRSRLTEGKKSAPRGMIRALAQRYRVTTTTIKSAIKGETWKHLPVQ